MNTSPDPRYDPRRNDDAGGMAIILILFASIPITAAVAAIYFLIG